MAKSGIKEYTAVQKLTAAVNGDGSGQDLTTGSAQLTEGLKGLKTQVDELAQSTSAQQLTQLVQGLQQAKSSLSSLSEQSAQLSQLLQADAVAAQSISASHSAVMESLSGQAAAANEQIAASGADMAAQVNAQVDQVNGEIAQRNDQLSSSAASANSQIDAAVTAVNEAGASGAIDGDQAGDRAAEIIGGLEASSVSVEGVGSVDQVAAPDNTSVSISMPEEDANI